MTSHELDQEVHSIMRLAERFVAFVFGLGLIGLLLWLGYMIILLWGKL